MIVAIKSEMDSRPLLYPLIRVLNNYGSLCVITSNKQLNRLIEDEDNGGFRNIRVIVEESGAVDSVYYEYGITKDDYTFIVLDNMGVMEYDVLVVPVGEKISEDFQEEVDLLKTDVNVRFIQFGKNVKKSSDRPKKEERRPARKRRGEELPEVDINEEEDDDPADKFKVHTDIDEEFNVSERFYGCKFISYDEIEDMESKYLLPKPGTELANAFYDIFKDKFGVDKRTYDKEVRRDDEKVRGAVNSVDADIDSNPRKRRKR